MLTDSFYIDETGGRPVICNKRTEMRLEIFNLEDESFAAAKDQNVFYADDHGTPIAIVVHYDISNDEEIARAVKWYANYLDYPQMDVSLDDPRPPFKLRIVK